MNVVEVERAARLAAECIHETSAPYFLECRAYRFRAHSMFDAQLYRSKAEVEEHMKRDPILLLTDWGKQSGLLHESDVAAIEGEVAREVDASVAFSEGGRWEDVSNLMRDVGAGGG